MIGLFDPLCAKLAALLIAICSSVVQTGLPVYRTAIAKRTIHRLGGSFETEARGPQWLRSWLDENWDAEDALDELVQVDLYQRPAADQDLAMLHGLTGIREVMLSGTRITDDGLKHLAGLQNLEVLYFGGWMVGTTEIGDGGLAHLRNLTNLKTLSLYDTRVTAAGLVHLREMRQLAELELPPMNWSDKALSHLAGMRELERLAVFGRSVTDAGIAHLAGLNGLEELTLENTSVTDAGLVTHAERPTGGRAARSS